MGIREAIALHQQGRVTEAEAAYEDVLRARPDHAAALSLLGLLTLKTDRPSRAAELLRRAVELNPGDAAASANLDAALNSLATAAINRSAELHGLCRSEEHTSELQSH